MRATDLASVGLGMEAPIEWILVLRLAGRAHWEDAHGRLITIIRDILNDRKARTTIGAVDERIAVAPIPGIEEFT